MSSPTRRSVLSPSKSHNISKNTPLKSKNSSPFNSNSTIKIPKLNNNSILTPSKKNPAKRPKLGFTIFEDKPSTSINNNRSSTPSRSPSPVRSNKLDHNDQENILQPKVLNLKQHNTPGKRMPLGKLSTNEYPGYIHQNNASNNEVSLMAPVKLTESYVPPNFKSDTTSHAHKFTSLPSFVTPPRSNLAHNDKYLVKSDTIDIDEDIEDMVERQLIAKQKNLRARKHKRSMSVGKNDAKLPLISKNKFTVLSMSS